MRSILLGFALVLTLAAAPARAVDSPSRLASDLGRIALSQPELSVVAWVHFTDRAGAERDPRALAGLRRTWPARALDRRSRRGTLRGLEVGDLPVHASYVQALAARGARVRGTSRWLNAASVEVPAGIAAELAKLPFVARVERVAVARRSLPIGRGEEFGLGGAPTMHEGSGAGPLGSAGAAAPGDTAYYGSSFHQLAMMQVPQLHASGLTGAGVLVCMLDTGYRLTHEVFGSLDVVAARDFIHRDANVDYDSNQDVAGQPAHGTQTLACVAGSKPGVYSGPAFGASVALAKTEYLPTETPVEMDYWQFAAEWADSLGADIISASLGYTDFPQEPEASYDYSDMDGRTTVVTRAAAEAARRGITVVTAAGNQGGSPWHYIVAPGDADTVITVGAVTSTGAVADFSSRGPTADGRIKPDVVAMGVAVRMPSYREPPEPTTSTSYVSSNGTSFATPLTAGLAALLLQAHPTWGPYEVREALRETATHHANPDTVRGWGLVQGVAAHGWTPGTVGVPAPLAASGLRLAVGPNPIRRGDAIQLRIAAPGEGRVEIDVLDLAGRRRTRVFEGEAPGARLARWDGTDARGEPLAAGVYWVRATAASGASTAARIVLLP